MYITKQAKDILKEHGITRKTLDEYSVSQLKQLGLTAIDARSCPSSAVALVADGEDIILRYRKDDGNPLSSEGNHHLLCFRQFLLHVSAAGSRDMQ